MKSAFQTSLVIITSGKITSRQIHMTLKKLIGFYSVVKVKSANKIDIRRKKIQQYYIHPSK